MSLTAEVLGGPLPDSWQEDAECRDVDVELFFSTDDDDERRALELCKACPVREECLRFAVENREMYGTWGGVAESDRKSMIREHRRRERERRKQQEAA